MRQSPFAGDIQPARVPLLAPGSGRPSLPFPHPWNYQDPLSILETYFWNADQQRGPARHSCYLDVPGLMPVLVTRDPGVIRAVAQKTGADTGQFDRDTLPSRGIARATGRDTLLYANGPLWKRQKKLAMPSFNRSSLFQPEQLHAFESTFRETVHKRLDAMQERLRHEGSPLRVRLEPDIKTVMLELLVNTFFGTNLSYEKIRDHYVPALEYVIDYIVRDTVINKLGIPLRLLPGLTAGIRRAKHAKAVFEELVDAVLETRPAGLGLWGHFKSDAPNERLRSNIRVFLAGALEATSSYAAWTIAHLARNPDAQAKVYNEVKLMQTYTTDNLAEAVYFRQALDETLRLTPALYFMPRHATTDTWVKTSSGNTLMIPQGTHVLLDVWHANRNEEIWGQKVTGYPARTYSPERWAHLAANENADKDLMHFGFGHGPRFCPGKDLGQLEVALVVGAFVKLFQFKAVHPENPAKVGVSTKPADGVLIELELRDTSADSTGPER